jgi:formylglycine-generating enzyme required for sulfatase activity
VLVQIWVLVGILFAGTAPVGSIRQKALGIHGLSGNVWASCEDWFSPRYCEDSPKRNPTGPLSGLTKVDRGGAWNTMPRIVRTTNRHDADLSRRFFTVGFRLVVPVR